MPLVRRAEAVLIALAFAVVALAAVPAPATAAPVDVRINEVESSGGTPGDWVELYNPTGAPIDVSGFVIKDNDDTHVFTIPAETTPLAAGGFATFDVESAFGLGAADSARLYLADGTTLVDSYTWTAHAATTYGRCADGTGTFVTTVSSTKDTANACTVSVPATVKFNEVESNGDPVGDWAELVNTAAWPVDISGLKFKDGDDGHAFFTIPASTTIAAGGYYVFNEADFGFGLGTPDTVRLFASDGATLVDSYSWTPHAATTYGRCPNATGAFTTTTSPTKGAANDCSSPVRINEVESTGDATDWIELTNPSGSAIDVSGWLLKDDDDTHVFTVPASTSLPAGGYMAFDVDAAFGLGSADTARVFQADGTTLVDSYTWAAHASTTYGRCPNGSGAFTTTLAATKGASNLCPGDLVTTAWPGGTTVATADANGVLGGDVSGLAYEAGATDALWAVNNGDGALVRLTKDGSAWTAASTRALHYPGGAGIPDSEGLTLTAGNSAGGVYVATERNNAANTVSRPAVLRFSTAGTGDLTATDEWNLTADLPAVAANAGLEGIAWVPDSYLTAQGLHDEHTGAAYSPASYPGHGEGLFAVGLEGNGRIYLYALVPGGTFTRVTSFPSGFASVMDLAWDPERAGLWAVCDDTCQGRTTILRIDDTDNFVVDEAFERPSGMPNLNNEGFALTPRSACVSNVKPVFWSDDSATGGHAVRSGTIACTPLTAQTVQFTSTAPASPVVGQTYDVGATGGGSGNPVELSVIPAVAGGCTLAGSTVTFHHVGSCQIEAEQEGDDDHAAGSASQEVTVGKAPTTVQLAVHDGSVDGTVTGPAPTGTVRLLVDGTVIDTDELSGSPAAYSFDHDVAPGGTRHVEVEYLGDSDHLAAEAAVDRRDPLMVAKVSGRPTRGWYRGAVTVTFTCTAQGSAVVACPAPVTLTKNGANQSVTRTVIAEDGGTRAVTVTGISIDALDPKVAIKGVKAGGTYRGKAPKATCKATDAHSGVLSCKLRTTKQGTKVTVVATATDKAGNVATTKVTYRLLPKR